LVVLDAGLGDAGLVWQTVQEQAAVYGRVCSYDRAGYGWSDPGPNPRTYQKAAEELHTLLRNAGEQGPFVLVGHSAGANTIRLYANGHKIAEFTDSSFDHGQFGLVIGSSNTDNLTVYVDVTEYWKLNQ
jgi:pimeloyl-ACP methyl ester carboxylesterase